MFSDLLSKTTILLICIVFLTPIALGQTIFSETFDEADDAIIGIDDIGGVNWETTCVDCIDAGDFFKVSGGELVGQDTNGPGIWETEAIDISSCDFIEIELNISEEGSLEACGTGCNSVDYIQLEYNIDGAGWVSPPDAYLCTGDCAGVMVIHSDDIDGGEMTYATGCLEGGDDLQIRVTIQAWAGSERWIIDDVTVSCAEGPGVDAGGDITICEGEEVTLEADNPDLADISWDLGIVDGVAFEPTLGTHIYTVTATAGECFSTDDLTVIVTEITAVVVDPAGPFGEGSGVHTLTATPDDGIWTAACGACIDAATGDFDPAIAGPGVWEVCYTAGIAPCDDTDCIDVEVTEECPLEGTITSSNPSCFGLSDGEVAITITGTTGLVTYEITNATGDIVNIGNDNFATGLTDGWYYFEVEDAYPCLYIDSVLLVMPEELIVDLSLQNPLCNGDFNGFAHIDTIYNYVGDYDALSISWEPIGVGGAGIFEANDLEEGSYTVNIEDLNGCEITVPFDLVSPLVLTINTISVTDASCFGMADGIVEVEGVGGTAPYLFSLDGAIFGGASLFDALGAGDYTVTVKDANECESELDFTITEPAAFSVTTNITHETCAGDCSGIIDLLAFDGLAPFSYSIDDCVTALPTGTFSDLCAGDYVVCITDNAGCSQNSIVTVNLGDDVLDGAISPVGPVCVNDAPIALESGAFGVLTGPGVIGTSFDPSIAGVGVATIVNSLDGVCSSSGSIDILVNDIPSVSFTANQTRGCLPTDISFYDTGDIGMLYEWSFGDGTSLIGGPDITHTYSSEGLMDVSLTLTDANGCTNDAINIEFIEIFRGPTALFNYNASEISTLNPTVDFTNYSVNSSEWEWVFVDHGESTLEHPSYTFPEEEGIYEVICIAKNGTGCVDSISKFITIDPEYSVYIPNAITLDGDQYNNSFRPYFNGIDIYSYSMLIFNRWGEIVFESQNPDVGWDGTYNGQRVQEGVYIYKIQTSEVKSDKRLIYNGHITVLE